MSGIATQFMFFYSAPSIVIDIPEDGGSTGYPIYRPLSPFGDLPLPNISVKYADKERPIPAYSLPENF